MRMAGLLVSLLGLEPQCLFLGLLTISTGQLPADTKRAVGRFDHLLILLAGHKSERTARGFDNNRARCAVGIIDKLVQPDLRYGPHTHYRFVDELEIRDARVAGAHDLVAENVRAL